MSRSLLGVLKLKIVKVLLSLPASNCCQSVETTGQICLNKLDCENFDLK